MQSILKVKVTIIRLMLSTAVLLNCHACHSQKENNNTVDEPSSSAFSNNTGPADTVIIRSHLVALTQTPSFRTHREVAQLDQTAEYIRSQFARYAKTTVLQPFSAGGRAYKNVIASFGPKDAARIVVGAHYDVCGSQPGADDNASGVTGLLELARMLNGKDLKYRIDLVAYSLEEPPYFRTNQMGSYVHAKSLSDEGATIYGMIALEMIGYFSDEPNSQSYPDGVPPELFGDKGNYIALVTKTGGGPFQKKFCAAFKSAATVKSNQYMGPPSMPGIDFSDHLNYWRFNVDAMMITDTSFYRNKNYHASTDTIDTLDLTRMAKVIDGIYDALLAL